jgi:hypothetical protein
MGSAFPRIKPSFIRYEWEEPLDASQKCLVLNGIISSREAFLELPMDLKDTILFQTVELGHNVEQQSLG